MLDGSKRLGSGHLARLLSSVRGRRKAKVSQNDQELLRRIWAALKVARDNKALIISKDGAIVNVNSLASELCGRNAEELAGRFVVTELFESTQSPHPAATTERWEATLKTASGARIPVEVTYEALGADLEDLEVYAIRDLRERLGTAAELEHFSLRVEQQHELLKEQEGKLREQNVQLDAALNNIVQGLAMFDVEHRLVLSNRRYAEIYGLASDQVEPGTPLEKIIEHRVSNGLQSEMSPEEIVGSMLRRPNDTNFGEFYSHLSDGRCIAITVQPMADGGTVTTHQDITEQRRAEAKIAHMALHDALTDLPNRTLLNEHLERALARVKRGEIVAIHLLDLDYFKNVNDSLGHPIGDKLLKMVAERLRGLVREADIVARMGGDEFAIVQVGVTQPSDATSLAQRVVDAVSKPYDIDGHQVIVGTSVGICISPADGTSPDSLLRNADLALYRAKSGGRGTLRFFEPDMDAQMQTRRAMESDLRKALVRGEFELHYQPIIDLRNNEISGFEALIRWPHSERGMVSPIKFIPLAEEIGLIVPLGEWVLRTACATAAKWPEHIRVCVNLSPIQFKNKGLVQVVVGALAGSGLRPGRLELEITETTLLTDTEETLAILHHLRKLGVRIAMDDFGTGYSSLSYLQTFPFDRIKIDRSFVKGVTSDPSSLNIVRAVVGLANGIGMAATAEGVETQEQLETIKSEGCTEIQGFLFSQALPVHEIERRFLTKIREFQVAASSS
jgi:diguanylate cyclase (GGDEF)-like protein